MERRTRRRVLKTGATLAATVGVAGTAAAGNRGGNKGDNGNNGKQFGRVWADGTLFRTNVVKTLDEQPDPDDPIYFLHDGSAPIVGSVGAQGSPFVSKSSPGERSWNGGQWTHFSAEVTDVEAFRAAVAEDGPFASSERVVSADFVEVTLGRPGFGPPNFFLCPLNGRA